MLLALWQSDSKETKYNCTLHYLCEPEVDSVWKLCFGSCSSKQQRSLLWLVSETIRCCYTANTLTIELPSHSIDHILFPLNMGVLGKFYSLTAVVRCARRHSTVAINRRTHWLHCDDLCTAVRQRNQNIFQFFLKCTENYLVLLARWHSAERYH